MKERTGHPTTRLVARARAGKSLQEKRLEGDVNTVITEWWNYRELSPLYTLQIVYNEMSGF